MSIQNSDLHTRALRLALIKRQASTIQLLRWEPATVRFAPQAVIQKSASPPNEVNTLSRHRTLLILKGARFGTAWLAFSRLFDLHTSCTLRFLTDRKANSSVQSIIGSVADKVAVRAMVGCMKVER